MRSRFFTSLLVSCLLVFGCSDDKKKIEEKIGIRAAGS